MARRKSRSPRRARPTLVPEPPSPRRLTPGRALRIPLFFTVLLMAFALAPAARENPELMWSFVGAGATLLVWNAALWAAAVRRGRALALEVAIRKQHYVTAGAQLAIYVYWGWYWRDVYSFAFLIAAQLVFGFAFSALLTWSRRDTYTLGFGPFPIILSINLFLWFKPDWFYLQFLMVAVGFMAKELIQWTKDGRRTHIFNPSSFPLSVFSLGLILTGTTDLTSGVEIATSLLYPPHIYLLIFAVSLPGQYFFGVASMTLSAVATTYGLSLVYAATTGNAFFIESSIPIAVFLGMHLLFSDPSTSPRTDLGRVMFGVLYGSSVMVLYALLGHNGVPTFYDKLLAVPVLNLMIQITDRVARSPLLKRIDPAAMVERILPLRPNLAFMTIWAGLFFVIYSTSGSDVALARADTMMARGRVADSIAHYRTLLEDEPDHPVGHTKLGYALIQLGRVGEALPLLRRAVELNPDDAEAHNNLGLALMQAGEVNPAVTSLRRAVELNPDYAEAHYNLAQALTASGNPGEAVDQFREAIRARPEWPTALGALAWLQATDPRVGDSDEAVRIALRAAELSDHRDAAVLDALAAAYAASGRFEEASRTAEEAEAIAVASAPGLVDGIKARLSLYRAGRPLIAAEP